MKTNLTIATLLFYPLFVEMLGWWTLLPLGLAGLVILQNKSPAGADDTGEAKDK